MSDRLLDSGDVEAEDLNPACVRTPRQDGGERVDRAPRQRRVGVRFDVDLHREPGRDEVEQLIDEQRSLGGRSPSRSSSRPASTSAARRSCAHPVSVVPTGRYASCKQASAPSRVRHTSVSTPRSGPPASAARSACREESGP